MTAVDYILDGLKQYLELERELGTRQVEITETIPVIGAGPAKCSDVIPTTDKIAAKVEEKAVAQRKYEYVYLHDRPLSEGGVAMMKKIMDAMGDSVDATPVITEMPLPDAKVLVVLGGLALKKFFPGLRAEPGEWKTVGTRQVFVTNSPEYILRFATISPAIEVTKKKMWIGLKMVKQRVSQM